MKRNCPITRLRGRYETEEKRAVQVAVTKVDTCGADPHEIIVTKLDSESPGATSVQRVVVDQVKRWKHQGQNIGSHGEGGAMTFNQKRIKNMEVLEHPCDFLAGDGKPLLNMQIIVKEFRYPERSSDLEAPGLLFTSSYVFKGKEGNLKLKVVLSGPTGNILQTITYMQTDNKDRRYSITTNRDSRLKNQRKVEVSRDDLPYEAPVQNDAADPADGGGLFSDSQDSLFLKISSQILSGVSEIKESTEDGDCDVPMLQQIKDCPRDVEPAGGVEGGQAVPVEEVHRQTPALEQPLPDVSFNELSLERAEVENTLIGAQIHAQLLHDLQFDGVEKSSNNQSDEENSKEDEKLGDNDDRDSEDRNDTGSEEDSETFIKNWKREMEGDDSSIDMEVEEPGDSVE